MQASLRFYSDLTKPVVEGNFQNSGSGAKSVHCVVRNMCRLIIVFGVMSAVQRFSQTKCLIQ